MSTKGLFLKSKEGGWKCYCCSKIFRTRREMQFHCKTDHLDFDGSKTNKFIKAKRLGLSKPQISNETRIKLGNSWRNKHLPEEMKRKISERMKKFCLENPKNVPYIRNHSSKQSYPESYFEDLLKKENIFCEKEYHILTYWVDFCWPNKKLILEINGEQHYVDKKIVNHDKIRLEKLKNIGWTVKIIRWSKWQSLNKEEKENEIRSLKQLLI